MSERPRVTQADPDFVEAVVTELIRYRDARHLKDQDLAKLLGVSKPTLSKYLNRAMQIGGPVLARAFVVLEIQLTYRGKVISVRDFPIPEASPKPIGRQISFEFDSPYLFKETDGRLAVTLERKGPDTEGVLATVKIVS
jgi:transcriptional regulator with XRE-family HTH domain